MTLMIVVLEEWGITTEFAELEIENRSMRDLDDENLNLHHENMYRTYASDSTFNSCGFIIGY